MELRDAPSDECSQVWEGYSPQRQHDDLRTYNSKQLAD